VYTTCLFCHGNLGRNEVIEPFPVGRRLAFDAAKGRLWVVCTRCGRWNLTPVEERWDAVEECERRFRATTLRVSTDNIGLARLPDGVDLVRVGRALRPEFAAWRYGRELTRRRGSDLAGGIAAGVGGVVGLLGLVGLGMAATYAAGPAGMVGTYALSLLAPAAIVRRQRRRVVARVPGARGAIAIRAQDLPLVRFAPTGGETPVRLRAETTEGTVDIVGAAADRVAALAMARVNQVGGTRRAVADAVALVEDRGGPEQVLAQVAHHGPLRGLLHVERLALEMAVHEERERRAADGELASLAEAWREAEEIAAIADDMFLPAGVDTFIRRHRSD
jgi:hypothetical protein